MSKIWYNQESLILIKLEKAIEHHKIVHGTGKVRSASASYMKCPVVKIEFCLVEKDRFIILGEKKSLWGLCQCRISGPVLCGLI